MTDTISLAAYKEKPLSAFFKKGFDKLKEGFTFIRTLIVITKKVFML